MEINSGMNIGQRKIEVERLHNVSVGLCEPICEPIELL